MNAIYCEGCRRWYHIKCEDITQALLKELGKMPLGFWCTECTHSTHDQSSFDYSLSLQRLRDASDDSSPSLIKTAARREEIFMRKSNMTTAPPGFQQFQEDNHEIDRNAQRIVEKYGGKHDRLPVAVPGDGSCLFHSVSVALCGHTGMSQQLRVRTTIEMCLRERWYTQQNQDPVWEALNPSYAAAIKDCARRNESSGWTIQALSTVIGISIAQNS
jgi:hypothetical protein